MCEFKTDDFPWLVFIKMIIENAENEWEQYRQIAAENIDDEKVIEYFDKLFDKKIELFVCPKSSKLYRARQIKNNEWHKTGVGKHNPMNEFYSLIVSEEEYKKSQIDGLTISQENIMWLKYYKSNFNFSDEVKSKIEEFELKYKAPDFYGFEGKDCGIPPFCCRKENRLSTRQDEYLYLALEKDTAVYEMRPSIGQYYSVAECSNVKQLRLVNLRDSSTDIEQFNKNCVIAKISEPNTDSTDKFYKITQALSHYFAKKGFDGILYKSSINKEGSNVLLFNEKLVKFSSSDIVKIENIAVSILPVYPL